MLTNCPLGNKETHACWECSYGVERTSDNRDISGYDCIHPDYKETYKVKPQKVTHSFCPNCKKDVKFKIDWISVKENTPKGIITYKELYAICPHCGKEFYVPAVNDVNVIRRKKASAEPVKTQMQPTPIVTGEKAKEIEELLKMEQTEEVEQGIKVLEKMFGSTDLISRKQCLDTFYDLFVMEETRIAEASDEEIYRFQHALGKTPSACSKELIDCQVMKKEDVNN